MRSRLLIIPLMLLACAKSMRVPQLTGDTIGSKLQTQVDWSAASEEATGLLSAYIQVDTTNPPGNETVGAEFLAEVFAAEGIPSQVVEFAPGRSNLVARLESSGEERPLCLLSHIDVVTAEPEHWSYPPLSGAIAEGFVWGRGALDMKSTGVFQAMSMILLHRMKVPLKRDVILIAVGDEEVDNAGARFVKESMWDELDCADVLNEGGLGLDGLFFDDQVVNAISVGEKGALWIEMIASGEPGHGSTPRPGRAPERLQTALNKISSRKAEEQIPAELYVTLAEAGAEHGGLEGYVLQRESLVNAFVTSRLRDNPATLAAITNTVNITGFSGRQKPNVVPSEVSAVLDCRLLPGTSQSDMIAELEELVDDPQVRFEVLHSFEGNKSPWENAVFQTLAKHAVSDMSNAVAGPVISVGFTDSIFMRDEKTNAYGFSPVVLTEKEFDGFHGHNERLSLENVSRGTRVMFGIVADLAAQ